MKLTFKLDPTLARAFGKEGIAAVETAKGKLVDAAITGEDVGTQITASQRRSADAQAELSRIEARLAAGGIGDRERMVKSIAGIVGKRLTYRRTDAIAA